MFDHIHITVSEVYTLNVWYCVYDPTDQFDLEQLADGNLNV